MVKKNGVGLVLRSTGSFSICIIDCVALIIVRDKGRGAQVHNWGLSDNIVSDYCRPSKTPNLQTSALRPQFMWQKELHPSTLPSHPRDAFE